MESEEQVLQDSSIETPSPVTQPISYARQTRADRLKQAAIEPDFVKQKVRSTEEILGDSVLQITPDEIDEIVRTSGVKGSLGEQAAVAVQNALMAYNSLTEYNTMSGGNSINYFTGNNIGDEWRDIGFEAMLNREELMNINEKSVGGVRNWFAKLAGGGTSMGQMALEGFATFGILPLIKMGMIAYGEGTYNDLKKYADEHDGSLKGYEPKGIDVAVNTANGFIQAYIERKFGVASPRFLTGWSRGFWKEGFSGILQEFTQSEASDLAEFAKGNEEVSILLDNALDNLIDATVAFPLQGSLGAISNQQQRKRADALVARARAISKGRKEPIKEDFDAAKKINDAKEQGLVSVLTTEFKSAFDESTGEGKLQKRIAGELKRAVESRELDLDTTNETELAQRVEQIATQEALTAVSDALEKGQSVSELALNNIVYKDGAIWLEGLTPQVGDRAVSYARVLAERQSGLAEVNSKLDAINQEIATLKQDLAEAKAENKQAQVEKLQARIDKQNALAEKNRLQAERLKVQTAKLEKQIAKQEEKAKIPETVETEKVSAEVKPVEAPKREVLAQVKKKEPVTERKSLKEERVAKKQAKEGETFVYEGSEYDLSRVTKKDLSKAEKRKLDEYIAKKEAEKPTGDMESWAGKTNIEIADEQIKKAIEPILNELKAIATEDNVIINNGENQEKIKDIVAKADWKNIVNALLMKYDFDPDVIKWLRDSNVSRRLADNPDDYNTNLDALIDSIQTLDEYIGGFMDVPLFDFLEITEWAGKRKDIKDLIDKYDSDLYILPKSISEAETKILNYIGNEYMEAIEYDTGKTDILPDDWFSIKPEQEYLLQGTISGKGDTARGGYDEQLKRIILGEKSDLSTIQHEFAHYWMQNNFKWARSGLASQDWLRRWRDVEEWLGIEPQDRLLSKSASEKFAKAYERYILEGKVATELQWAFEGFQKAYQDIYEDLENEYFDLSEELAPEVVDWFNRNKEQSPKRMLQSDEQKIEKALTLAAGGAVVEQAGTDAVVMTENNEKGEPVVTMGVKQSEVPAGDNLLVYSDKATASKLQQSARKVFGDDVEVQKLTTLDTQATLENFTNWIKRDRAGAWDAMMDPSTSPIYQAYLYKAFAQEAMNDVDLAVQLANVDIAKAAREMGQAVQALNINNESGFDMLEIIRNLEKSKGTVSEEELNNSVAEIGLDNVELSQEEVDELENQTECKL